MKRTLTFLYGSTVYLACFGTLTFFMGFVGNLTPVGIDSPREAPLGTALLINTALVTLFAVQHTIMARQRFKRWVTQFISPAVERSTFVLVATVLLALMMWQWQPVGGVVWSVEDPVARGAIYAMYGFGWVLLLTASFVIDHFDLFGLRQVWLAFRGRPYTRVRFKNPWLYQQVRHPLYLGFFLGLWAAPTMTITHLAFAVGLSAYILIGVRFEERDLVTEHPEYAAYRARVPAFLPRLGRRATAPAVAADQSAA